MKNIVILGANEGIGYWMAKQLLEDGNLVGKGTHKELVKNCETYCQIAKSQLSEEELKGGVC